MDVKSVFSSLGHLLKVGWPIAQEVEALAEPLVKDLAPALPGLNVAFAVGELIKRTTSDYVDVIHANESAAQKAVESKGTVTITIPWYMIDDSLALVQLLKSTSVGKAISAPPAAKQ